MVKFNLQDEATAIQTVVLCVMEVKVNRIPFYKCVIVAFVLFMPFDLTSW